MSKFNNDDYETKSACSSICSQMSEVSISYNGTDDVPLDQAVDEIFGEIQRHVNQIHIELRNLVMADDRGDDYLECLEYHEKLSEHVIGGCDMFKSVIKVSKQLLPKKPAGWVDPRKAVGATIDDDSFVSI